MLFFKQILSFNYWYLKINISRPHWISFYIAIQYRWFFRGDMIKNISSLLVSIMQYRWFFRGDMIKNISSLLVSILQYRWFFRGDMIKNISSLLSHLQSTFFSALRCIAEPLQALPEETLHCCWYSKHERR